MQPSFQQIKHIYNHTLGAVIGQMIVSIGIFFILYNQVNNDDLFIWSSLKLVLLTTRIIFFYNYKSIFNNSDSNKAYSWFIYYRILMFLSGLLWASCLFFVDQFQNSNLLFFFLATFFAMSGAAIATLGSIMSIYFAFTFPMFFATLTALFLSPLPVHFETALLTAVGFVFLIYAAFKNSVTISALLQKNIEIESAQKDIINRLARAGEYRDNDTGQHVKRMSHSCYLLALKAGFSKYKAEQLNLASALHDIGKIGISDSILLSPNKLNKEEWEIMKTHTAIGENILKDHNSPIMDLASKVAAGHHERWDGNGYPKGIAGKDIPIEMRIVSICDTFDALISKRPYKEAWPIEEAIDYIRKESGKHFDPELVDLFLNISPDIIQFAKNHNDQ